MYSAERLACQEVAQVATVLAGLQTDREEDDFQLYGSRSGHAGAHSRLRGLKNVLRGNIYNRAFVAWRQMRTEYEKHKEERRKKQDARDKVDTGSRKDATSQKSRNLRRRIHLPAQRP